MTLRRFLSIGLRFVSLVMVACVGGPLPAEAAGPAAGKAGDWRHFRGPSGDGICQETGLLQQWPEGGPKLLWKLEGLGRGFSTVTFADGRMFTMGDIAPAGQPEAQFVIAYDLATRKELWHSRVGPAHKAGDGGPRSTPTIDGELAYAIGSEGDLVCVETATGSLRWRKNFAKDFGGKMMSMWKFAESPLVDGEKLLCTPGGKDATIVALNKVTGELIWKCGIPNIGDRGKDGAGYSSMVVAEIDGVRQYVQMLGRGAVGVAADSGKFLWGCNKIANGTANITTPVVRGNYVFVSAAYNSGSALLKITGNGDEMKVDEVYTLGAREFQNHHGGVVLAGGYLYGGDGQNKGTPTCLDFMTGKIAWKPRALAGGSAAVLYADGNVIFRYDSGLVVLAEATPTAMKVKGKFTPVAGEGPAWPHPVIYDGRLYLRHGDILACYDVRG